VSPDAPAQEDSVARRHGTRPPPKPERDQATMSFIEHLEELRATLFFLLVTAAVAASGAWFVSKWVLDRLVNPEVDRVYYGAPAEAFMIRIKVSTAIGLLVALPILLARLWGFIAPGLFRNERRMVVPVLVGSALLFYAGLAFAWFFVVPRMMTFFLSFGSERLAPLLNVSDYFGFVAKFCLAFGLAFQLPLVLVMLSALGLVSPQRLWSQWRYGIVLIFILAAWLTPPDVVSQVMMGVPLVVLYLAALVVASIVGRKRHGSVSRGDSR
jgi:sec-independent protein translocase protein TatC